MAQSLRLRWATWGARKFVRPYLSRAGTPKDAKIGFDRASELFFKTPPYLVHSPSSVGELTLHRISVGNPKPRQIILYFHGGAYLSGSGATHRGMLGRISKLSGVEICAPDYRLLQDAPFPAAFDDARAAWDHLMSRGYEPNDIILGGDSAGGGLMLALLADLTQRDQTPAAAFAFSPWTDLTLSGDTLHCATEAILPMARIDEAVDQLLCGAARDDPHASPLFADFTAPPPVLIQVGCDEALAADARRMAEKLGDAAILREKDTALHVFQILDGWLPEARDALQEVADFVQTSFESAKR